MFGSSEETASPQLSSNRRAHEARPVRKNAGALRKLLGPASLSGHVPQDGWPMDPSTAELVGSVQAVAVSSAEIATCRLGASCASPFAGPIFKLLSMYGGERGRSGPSSRATAVCSS